MNYFEYLKTKTKFLVIWFIIHGLALFVNIFNIEGRIYYIPRASRYGRGQYANLFTNRFESSDDFWPFVNFLYEGDYSKGFRGIFYDYGIAEFIAYSVLIFIIYYFRYESQKSKNKTINTN